MRTKETIPSGLYRVRMYAYCGMSYDIITGTDLSRATYELACTARRRRREGFTVARLFEGGTKQLAYEFTEPDTAMMVPDTAGTCYVEPETVPAVRCFECDDLVAIGETCSCHDYNDNGLSDCRCFPCDGEDCDCDCHQAI